MQSGQSTGNKYFLYNLSLVPTFIEQLWETMLMVACTFEPLQFVSFTLCRSYTFIP